MDLSKYFLPTEKSEYRLNICKSCTNFIELTQMCNKCMCIMPMKVKLAPASCPENKWLHVTIETQS